MVRRVVRAYCRIWLAIDRLPVPASCAVAAGCFCGMAPQGKIHLRKRPQPREKQIWTRRCETVPIFVAHRAAWRPASMPQRRRQTPYQALAFPRRRSMSGGTTSSPSRKATVYRAIRSLVCHDPQVSRRTASAGGMPDVLPTAASLVMPGSTKWVLIAQRMRTAIGRSVCRAWSRMPGPLKSFDGRADRCSARARAPLNPA